MDKEGSGGRRWEREGEEHRGEVNRSGVDLLLSSFTAVCALVYSRAPSNLQSRELII